MPVRSAGDGGRDDDPQHGAGRADAEKQACCAEFCEIKTGPFAASNGTRMHRFLQSGTPAPNEDYDVPGRYSGSRSSGLRACLPGFPQWRV